MLRSHNCLGGHRNSGLFRMVLHNLGVISTADARENPHSGCKAEISPVGRDDIREDEAGLCFPWTEISDYAREVIGPGCKKKVVNSLNRRRLWVSSRPHGRDLLFFS